MALSALDMFLDVTTDAIQLYQFMEEPRRKQEMAGMCDDIINAVMEWWAAMFGAFPQPPACGELEFYNPITGKCEPIVYPGTPKYTGIEYDPKVSYLGTAAQVQGAATKPGKTGYVFKMNYWFSGDPAFGIVPLDWQGVVGVDEGNGNKYDIPVTNVGTEQLVIYTTDVPPEQVMICINITSVKNYQTKNWVDWAQISSYRKKWTSCNRGDTLIGASQRPWKLTRNA